MQLIDSVLTAFFQFCSYACVSRSPGVKFLLSLVVHDMHCMCLSLINGLFLVHPCACAICHSFSRWYRQQSTTLEYPFSYCNMVVLSTQRPLQLPQSHQAIEYRSFRALTAALNGMGRDQRVLNSILEFRSAKRKGRQAHMPDTGTGQAHSGPEILFFAPVDHKEPVFFTVQVCQFQLPS